jgi:hypothetical protein
LSKPSRVLGDCVECGRVYCKTPEASPCGLFAG